MTPSADGPLTGLDRYIERVRADWKNVGVAIAVVQGSEVIYARGFGVRELGKPATITPDTLFQIGSTTKAFTTAALGMLVDEGKIRWDDPVIDYLPGFQLQDPWLTRHLTIRDAVAHRSGIADNYYPYLAVMNKDQVVRQLRYLKADGRFRDSFRYNNLLYAAMGKVIEAVSAMTWEEFVERRVLAPLGMKRSGTSAYQYWDARHVAPTFYGSAPDGRGSIDAARDANVAMPHGLDASGSVQVLPWVSFDFGAPAGSVVSSAADMANWLMLHLNEGKFAGRQLLQQHTLRELHATQNLRLDATMFPFDKVDGAMGWFRGMYQGHAQVAHGGGMLGFPAYVALLPDRQMGIVVLSNGPVAVGDDYKFHRAIALWTFDRLLGAAHRDWSNEYLLELLGVQQAAQKATDELHRSRLADAPPRLPLEKYAADYEDRRVPSGRVNVRVENGRLALSFAGAGAFSGHLEHWHHDQFRLRSNTAGHDGLELGFAAFGIDAGGKASSMTLSSAYFGFALERV